MIGQTLSHFKITAKLGEGGMGEVYRAEDTKLGREVAIKVLPEDLSRDAERLARFEREARVLASLNHPHIASLHQIEEDGGKKLLVMELVEGEDLADKMSRESIQMPDAVEIAMQVADALQAAHARGIVHRDLKPANIKMTADGQVKVLDFGLAKAQESAAGEGPDATRSPTLTAQMTQAGVILGTAAYMSPEQARGQEADPRSDIWALGVVLFEMLSGARLFAAPTVSDVLAAVLRAEIDLDALPPEVPELLRRALARCLTREPQYRYHSAADLRLDLLEATSEAEKHKDDVESPAFRKSRAAAALLLAGLAGAALTAAVWLLAAPREQPTGPTVLPLALGAEPLAARMGAAAIVSRDGRHLAWLQAEPDRSVHALWVRDLDSGETRLLPGTEEAENPFFSPDGREIAFFTGSALRKVALDGSSSVYLAEVGDARGGTWVDDGSLVFNRDTRDGLWRVSATGGDVERLTEPDRDRNERSHRWPDAIPNTRLVAFLAQELGQEYESATIEALDLDTRERTVLHRGGSYPRVAGTDRLLFVRNRALFTAPLRLDPPRLTSQPIRVLDEIGYARWSGGAQISVSATGSLLYSVGEGRDEAIMVRRGSNGDPLGVVLPAPGYYNSPKLSPDGTRLAFSLYTGTRTDIWVLELGRDAPSRLTFGGRDLSPVWSPDGRSLAFAAMTDRSVPNVFVQSADGAGQPRELTRSGNQQSPTSWSRDGVLLYEEIAPETRHDIYALDVSTTGTPPRAIAATPAMESDARFSPDGRWIAYASDGLGSREVFVRPYPSLSGRWQVSQGDGSRPSWSGDGRKLYYWAGRNLIEHEVTLGDETLTLGERRPVLDFEEAELRDADYAVADDGSLFLLERAGGGGRQSETLLILDWTSGLEDDSR